jgi:hypothetical protein
MGMHPYDEVTYTIGNMRFVITLMLLTRAQRPSPDPYLTHQFLLLHQGHYLHLQSSKQSVIQDLCEALAHEPSTLTNCPYFF